MCVGCRGRGLEWDVKGQHKRARGYREEGGAGVLHHAGYEGEGTPRSGGRWEEPPHTGREVPGMDGQSARKRDREGKGVQTLGERSLSRIQGWRRMGVWSAEGWD